MDGLVDGTPGKDNRLVILIVVVTMALAAAGYVLASRGANRVDTGEEPAAAVWTDVTPDRLNEMLRQGDYFLVNVHVPYAGELPETDAFVPFDAVRENISRFPSDRNAPIVVYCRAGHMSVIAARTLTSLGYRNVYNLQGGFEAWRQAGYPLLQRRSP